MGVGSRDKGGGWADGGGGERTGGQEVRVVRGTGIGE